MTAIVSAVTLYNNSHIPNHVDPSPAPSFSFLQLMNSSLDAILATGSEAIGGHSNGGYGSGGAISTETERRRSSSAQSGAVGLPHQPTAESPSASSTAPFDSFHHAIAQETHNVTTPSASPSHPSPFAYHHQPNHSLHISSPPQGILYSSSPSYSPSDQMSITSVMNEAPSSTSSSASSAATAKRTAPEYAEGSSSRSSKKNRKSRMVIVSGEDENADKVVIAAAKQLSPMTPATLPQKEEPKQQHAASQPSSTTVKPPAPPRSPSPPHDLHKPAIPSPLCPSTSSPCIPSRPPLTRRRTRSNEIALLKFALDPWLRLSRSLEGSKTALGNGCKKTAFNPATFPAAGNLLDLRMSRSCASSFSSSANYGSSSDEFELNLPFNFGAVSSEITFGFGNGDLAGGVKWNLVDA